MADVKTTWGPETELGFPVEAGVRVELRNEEGKGYVLSIMGNLKVKKCEELGLPSSHYTAGQCQEMGEHLAKCGLYSPTLDKIVSIWKKWHLNDMHAGSEAQEAFLENYRKDHPGFPNDYNEECKLLKKHRLYADKKALVNGKPYEYGRGWLFREIPKDVLVELCGCLDSGIILFKKGEKDEGKRSGRDCRRVGTLG